MIDTAMQESVVVPQPCAGNPASLGDLADDALIAIFLQLTTRQMARLIPVCHRFGTVVVRAAALGICLAPFRATASVELLSIKETVARGLRGFDGDEEKE